MSKKITKTAKKKTKPAARKATAKLDQRPVILSAPRPKKVLSTSTVRPTKKDAPKKPKVKAAQRPSAPQPKEPAREPATEPQPLTIMPVQDSAPAPYYPSYAPKGEGRDFAPMAGYFDEATSVQDLRERMLFRRTLGNHPEDVLVAGKRKARVMGWNLDAIEVEPLAAPTTESEQLEAIKSDLPEASKAEPEQLEVLQAVVSDAVSGALDPSSRTAVTSKEQLDDWFKQLPTEITSEQPEASVVEPVQPEAVSVEPEQPHALTPEPELSPAPEHAAAQERTHAPEVETAP
jgi:hypothetical protein